MSELSTIRGEDITCLITSSDAPDHVPPGVLHQLAPGETRGSVLRFLDHWRPDAGLFIGAPDRPMLLAEAKSAGIPLFLAASSRGQILPDGWVSQQSASLFRQFDSILLSSAAEAQAIERLNLPSDQLRIAGPLSDTVLPPSCDPASVDALAAVLGGRPVWLAADVSEKDIAWVEAAQRHTIRAAHRLLLVIVPRDPSHGPDISRTLENKGWRTGLLSVGDVPDDSVQVFIVDETDVSGLWYRLAPVTYLGGSFETDTPTSDPFLPASLGSAVIHGPEHKGAAARIERLAKAGATLSVRQTDGLGAAVLSLLSPDKAATLAHAGWSVTSESAQVVDRLVALIDAAFDRRARQ